MMVRAAFGERQCEQEGHHVGGLHFLFLVVGEGGKALAGHQQAAVGAISGIREETSGLDLARVRRAIREQRKERTTYTDQDGVVSKRTIWPIMLGFFESRRLIAAWCESSGDYVRLRAEHIGKAEFLDHHYAGNRRQLAREWRARKKRECTE